MRDMHIHTRFSCDLDAKMEDYFLEEYLAISKWLNWSDDCIIVSRWGDYCMKNMNL